MKLRKICGPWFYPFLDPWVGDDSTIERASEQTNANDDYDLLHGTLCVSLSPAKTHPEESRRRRRHHLRGGEGGENGARCIPDSAFVIQTLAR